MCPGGFAESNWFWCCFLKKKCSSAPTAPAFFDTKGKYMEAMSRHQEKPASDTSCFFGNCSSLHAKTVWNYRALYIPRWLGMGFLNHQQYVSFFLVRFFQDITKSGLLEQHDVNEWITRGSRVPPGFRVARGQRKLRKSSQLSGLELCGW